MEESVNQQRSDFYPSVSNHAKLTRFSNIQCFHKVTTLTVLLFSAHIFYGKGKYLNQTVFLQNLPSTKFIFNFKGYP